MVVFPYIKLNLGLNVLRKRDDGYHELETCFIDVNGCCDVLEVVAAKDSVSTLSTFGLPIDSPTEDNLVMKAYRILEEKHGLPAVEMALLKNIPAGSGVGAGSSDASHALLALNNLFDLRLSRDQLATYALKLGSDCPYFIYGGKMLGKGRGEQLSPLELDLNACWVKVLFPGLHVSTKQAFAGLTPSMPSLSIANLLAKNRLAWKDELKNDFEPSVFALHPLLKEQKAALYDEGAFYASMSGSGSTMYGLFESMPSTDLGWAVDSQTLHKIWTGRLA